MNQTPLIAIHGVTRAYGGLRPLRIRAFEARAADRIVLTGFDQGAAESFVHLVTGAALPEAGEVRIDGRATHEASADTDWLRSLDRFGLVTERAVLLEQLSTAANLALPLTLAVDPMTDEARAHAEDLALAVALTPRLDAAAGTLTPAERLRVHLARAVATGPDMLLLEHPTAALAEPAEREAFGRLLVAVAEARGCGWIALTADDVFARATGVPARRLAPATGDLTDGGGRGWRRWFGSR
ncbi:MAG: ATP-binding cassette domain-containing protein [Vicinamibacterales bacterium]